MEWLIQYKIKGNTEILKHHEHFPEFITKREVISWWKDNMNVHKDKELVNCSDAGTLKVKDELLCEKIKDTKGTIHIGHYKLEMKLIAANLQVSATLTSSQMHDIDAAGASALDQMHTALKNEYIEHIIKKK